MVTRYITILERYQPPIPEVRHSGGSPFRTVRRKKFIQDAYLAIRPAMTNSRWDIGDVKARNGQKFEFLAHPVENPWPKWMALCQNVCRSLPYIFDCTSRRWEETGTIAGWSTIGEIKKTGFASLIFGPPRRTTWPMGPNTCDSWRGER